MGSLIWTGSYTADSNGSGKGIGALSLGEDGHLAALGLAAAADSPSFLAIHPGLPVVYAVEERAQAVRAFRRTARSGLEPLGGPWPAGKAACHVAVDPQGRFLVVNCWGDGQVVLYELDHDGGITSRYSAAAAVDPYNAGPTADRRPSRAHAGLMLPDGRVMTTDLGHDLLRVWRYVPGEGLVADHQVVLPKGSGPRHLVQHPSGSILVVTEYSIEVAVVRASPDGTFELAALVSSSAAGAFDGDSAAEIGLSPDGRHAYVGIRGSNRICVLRVTEDGTRLKPLAEVPSGGNWPRHHLVHGDWLHVAHERSNDVVTFRLDPESGLPEGPVSRVETGSPTVLLAG